MSACVQCGRDSSTGVTCGRSECQEAEYYANASRAEGLRQDGRPRKGWIWCSGAGCNAVVRISDESALCEWHRRTPRPRLLLVPQ